LEGKKTEYNTPVGLAGFEALEPNAEYANCLSSLDTLDCDRSDYHCVPSWPWERSLFESSIIIVYSVQDLFYPKTFHASLLAAE
jgi:hypothetical protein